MNSYVLAGLVVAQSIVAAQPAAAATYQDTATVQSGTFAGARLRLSLGGKQEDRRVRAGLAFAPTLRSQSGSGEVRTRIGEGVELGFTGDRPLTLSLAGRPVSQLLPGQSKLEDERQMGISTGGYVAIGVGVALVVGGFVLVQHYKEIDEHSD